jgi:hypothetical protein
LHLNEIDKDVGLAAQFVGYHRGLARNSRDNGDMNASALDR